MPEEVLAAHGSASQRSLRGLDWLNFFLADTQAGVGPFLAIYLSAAQHWNPAQVGIALSVAGFTGVAAGFLALAAIALVAWLLLLMAVPESRSTEIVAASLAA